MRSGQPSHDYSYTEVPAAETIRNMRYLRPSAELRDTFQYNNAHYVALSHLIPTLTGTPFIDYVQEHFFNPLNMTSTTYDHKKAAATGHRTDGFTHRHVNITQCAAKSTVAKRDASCHGEPAPFGWYTYGDGIDIAGAGGVVSSLRDVTKWLAELLDPRVVSPSILDEAATPRTVVTRVVEPGNAGLPYLYGAGQFILVYRGHKVVMHTGGVPGQSTLIARLPGAGVGVAVLTNDADFGVQAFMTTFAAVLDDLLGLSPNSVEEKWFKRYLASAPTQPKEDGKEPEYGLDAVPGSYEGEGYGVLELAPIDTEDPIQAAIMDGLHGSGVATKHVFVAPFKRVFGTHLVFTHWDREHFNWTLIIAHDEKQGFGRGTRSNGPAVITREGIGMFGGFNAPGAGVEKKTPEVEDVERRSEVWFARK